MWDARRLPAQLVGHRFYLQTTTVSGSPLTFFTDTGGGMLLVESAVNRLSLETRLIGDGESRARFVEFPVLRDDVWIPPVSIDDDPRPPEYRGRLFVATDSEFHFRGDGMLGQEWFGGRTWTFDYPEGTLWLHASSSESLFDAAHTVPLGFRTNELSGRRLHFPSVVASVDGESHAFLFDTGATIVLSDGAVESFADGGDQRRATCFVVASVFDRWRLRHPKWRAIEGADPNYGGAPAIEVPEVEIAGHSVGPVWFTRRLDREFHEWMSQWTDRRVDGALGGSLLHYFTVTVDYRGARACFDRGVSTKQAHPVDG